MKHFEIFKGDNNLYGIRERQSLELIVDCQYKRIKEIENYKDLTTLNYSSVFLLSENFKDTHFCLIDEDGEFQLSKEKYENILFFYKGLTLCMQNREWIIIDSSENVLLKSTDFGFKVGSEDMYNPKKFLTDVANADTSFLIENNFDPQLFFELNRLFDMMGDNWNLGFIYENLGGREISRQNFILLPIEEKLGLNHETGINIGPEEYLKNLEYNLYTRTWLVEIETNKLAFINNYMYQVGDSFDKIFQPDNDLGISVPNAEIDNKIEFIGKDGKILLIELTGDFIKESIFYPELFCGFELVKEQIHQIRKLPRINPNEFVKRIYWKFDQAIFDKMLARELKLNPKFQFTDEWIDKILEKEILKNDAFQDYLPFQCVSTNNIECENNIEELNKLLGITYSSYQIIGEIGRYEVINEEYIPNIDLVKLNKILVTRTMSTHQKKRTPFQPGPGRNPRPKSGFFWPKGFNSDDKI
jgi:hypothetical protein